MNYRDTEKHSMDEGLVEVLYAVAVIVAAGIFGTALAFLVWGFK